MATEAVGVDLALVRSARGLVEGKGTREQGEILKLYERLDRFKQLAESSSAEGERDNAERMLVKTRKKLDSLTEAVVDEDLGI